MPKHDPGIYQDPNTLALRVSQLVGDHDGCVHCGYAFTYEDEGCDECAWVKVCLKIDDRLTKEDK